MHSHQWLLLTLTIVAAVAQHSSASPPRARPAAPAPIATFGFESVQRLAQQRAEQPYREPGNKLPDALARLTYDEYRDIRFRAESSLWRNQSLFEVEFFHRGSNYDKRINVYEVTDQGVSPVRYDPAQFDFGRNGSLAKVLTPEIGFAGLRVHYPLNTSAYKDELIAFLGASYFRLLGREQSYGASARGLAINVASTNGEEFPYFSDFWLVRPTPEQRTLTIYALLDSPSLAGHTTSRSAPAPTAVRGHCRPSTPARSREARRGAPDFHVLLWRGAPAPCFDDYRPEVHDSDGLHDEQRRWRVALAPAGQPEVAANLKASPMSIRAASVWRSATATSRTTRMKRPTTSAGPATGLHRSAIGARVSSSWSRSRPTKRSTITS